MGMFLSLYFIFFIIILIPLFYCSKKKKSTKGVRINVRQDKTKPPLYLKTDGAHLDLNNNSFSNCDKAAFKKTITLMSWL